jgi:type III restriction enzyme
VNHLGTYGRWAFLELTDVYLIQAQFAAMEEALNKLSENVTA